MRFDAIWWVQSADPDLALEVLDADLRELLLRQDVPGDVLRVEGVDVLWGLGWMPGSDDQLQDRFEFVAEVADRVEAALRRRSAPTSLLP